jgi:hypothetical protein
MKKYLFALLLSVSVVGCSKGYTDYSASYDVRPPELADCKIYNLSNGHGGSITVGRCPNSTTSVTYNVGKTTATTIVVDGVTYNTAAPAKAQTESTIVVDGVTYERKDKK